MRSTRHRLLPWLLHAFEWYPDESTSAVSPSHGTVIGIPWPAERYFIGPISCAPTRIASIPADGIGPEGHRCGLGGAECGGQPRRRIQAGGHASGLGQRALPPERGADAGGRAGPAARPGRHPVRGGGRAGHPRPCHAVGTAAADLPGVRSVRQYPPHPHPARRSQPAGRNCARRPGLADRAGEQRGRVRPATAGAPIAACRRRWRPRPPSSPAAGWSGSCASRSTRRAPAPAAT